jgi:hypothetical protein
MDLEDMFEEGYSGIYDENGEWYSFEISKMNNDGFGDSLGGDGSGDGHLLNDECSLNGDGRVYNSLYFTLF